MALALGELITDFINPETLPADPFPPALAVAVGLFEKDKAPVVNEILPPPPPPPTLLVPGPVPPFAVNVPAEDVTVPDAFIQILPPEPPPDTPV